MNMKFLKLIVILCIIICSTVLLNACSHMKEDNELIVKYLNNTFGKNTYTIRQDRHHWYVTLNKYPELTFFYTVSHDPFSMSSPSIKTDFDHVFGEYLVKKYKESYNLGKDELSFDSPINFVYYTKVTSLEELKIPYDRLMKFISFVSEKYPVLIDVGLMEIRMDIEGIHLKGMDDNDSIIYQHISEVKKDGLIIKSYEEICQELTPKLKTHLDNPDGIIFHADIGRSFILGSDTFEDCLYKSLVLENGTVDEVKKIILQPGELSEFYTFKSENQYKFTEINLQAKNLSDSPCSLFDATIIKAVIDGSEDIYIDPVWIELVFDKRREWKDPYEMLGVSPPKTEKENIEGVQYKNIKVLFEMNKYYKGVKKVTLTF